MSFCWWLVCINVEPTHFCPCLFPESVENECSIFAKYFDVGASEDDCASCIAEFSHAEQVVGE
jgi:hypothetical protein